MTQAENEHRDSMGVTCVSASDCTGENTTGGQHACTSTDLCYSLNIITSISSGIEPRRKLKPRESEVSLVSPTRTAAWALCTRLDSPFGARFPTATRPWHSIAAMMSNFPTDYTAKLTTETNPSLTASQHPQHARIQPCV